MVTPILQSDLDFSSLVGNSLQENSTIESSKRIQASFVVSLENTIPAGLVLWNQFETKDNVLSSTVGPDIELANYQIDSWAEADIVPGKFGNGLYVNQDIEEGWDGNDGANFFAANIQEMGLTPEQGAIEFWFTFKYGSDTFNHAYFFDSANQLTGHFPNSNMDTNVSMIGGWNGWDYGSYGKRFFFSIDNVSDAQPATTILTPDYSAAPGGSLDFVDGTTYHFAFVWDDNGIDTTSDTMRMYVDGNVVASGTQTWSTAGGFDPYLYLGGASNYNGWSSFYNAVKGVTDNLKIWNYAKTDFSDRFEEGSTTVTDITGTKQDDILTGTDGPDNIVALAGNDYIEALNGNDTIEGKNGDDLIEANSGNDLVKGDLGNDVINGDLGNDVLNGGDGEDIIRGGDGNDSIHGGLEKDLLFGDGGNDSIAGNDGNDLIEGDEGVDSLYGGKGNDTLRGGLDSDILYGQDDSDLLNGGDKADTLYGGKGADTIFGSNDGDFVSGNADNDSLNGGRGFDTLNGDDGNDTLVGVDTTNGLGAAEVDTLTGGTGEDVFVLGDRSSVYYDDGNDLSFGESDYGSIVDFDALQDRIQLYGSIESYILDFYTTEAGNLEATLFYNAGNTAKLEVIGVLENVSEDLTLTDSAFIFV